jgi:hypothetical protein
MELETIVKAIEGLVDKLAALVGMSPPAKAEAVRVLPSNWPRYHFTAPIPDITIPVKPEAVRTPRSGSTQYASATSDAGSDGSNSSIGLSRMTLGPSGAALLQKRSANVVSTPSSPTVSADAASPGGRESPECLQVYFNAAMLRFLSEQQGMGSTPLPPPPPAEPEPDGAPESQDEDMKSAGSTHDPPGPNEYDPDDLRVGASRQAAVATAGVSAGGGAMAPRIRVSAISELKEFSGMDGDEERARSWISKVKSAFVRDQALDSEKCTVFGDLLTGPARNWYRQLSRTTRSDRKGLFDGFMVQYCGRGVSVARK